MTTYTALQSRVLQIVIDTPTAVTTQVPTLVNEAIRTLQDRHGFKVCEAVTSVMQTTEATRVLAAAPSDWQKIREKPQLIDEQGRVWDLNWSDIREDVERRFGTIAGGTYTVGDLDGRPNTILQSEPSNELGGFNFEVFPLPDGLSLYTNGEYRIRIPYWKYLATLLSGGDQNWLTVNCANYIAYQAASDAFMLNWDEQRAGVWALRAKIELDKAILADKKMRMAATGDTLRMSVNARGPRSAVGGDFK